MAVLSSVVNNFVWRHKHTLTSHLSNFLLGSFQLATMNDQLSKKRLTRGCHVTRTCVAVTSSELVLNNECVSPPPSQTPAKPIFQPTGLKPVPPDQMERYDACFTLHFTVVTDIVIVMPFWSSLWPHKTSSYLVSFWLVILLQIKCLAD